MKLENIINHIFPIKTKLIGKYDVELDLRESIQLCIYHDSYEITETMWVKQLLRPGDNVVDIGCNIGYYALLASSIVGNCGNVIAIDPSEAICNLKQTVIINGISNIIALREGIGEKHKYMPLYPQPNTNGIFSPSFLSDGKQEPYGVSHITTLDEIAKRLSFAHIDFLKVDVEGYECNVLKGMDRLLEEHKVTYIMIELSHKSHEWIPESYTESMEILKSAGFKLVQSLEYPVHGDYLLKCDEALRYDKHRRTQSTNER
jgi:FkbM family methyltransferase